MEPSRKCVAPEIWRKKKAKLMNVASSQSGDEVRHKADQFTCRTGKILHPRSLAVRARFMSMQVRRNRKKNGSFFGMGIGKHAEGRSRGGSRLPFEVQHCDPENMEKVLLLRFPVITTH